MFSLTEHAATVVSVTNIAEKHGNQREPAISIGLCVTGSSTLLNHFNESLRTMFFQKEQLKPGALDLATDELNELRFPLLKNPSWAKEYAGYQLRFCIGATGKDDVLLNDVGIKGVSFNPLEGGSVQISFKAHAQPKDEHDHGRIARMLMQECSITLTPPDVDPSLFDDSDEE
ncbi:hypothetical protein A9R05_06735 [Burkholderia sp. KK1]|nr:hypothetical protein A9R05_06735 [Burkholderia sp. KK1]